MPNAPSPIRDRCDCCVNTFSTKEAEGDLKRYRRQGPDGTTRALIDAIVEAGVTDATVLDIGGGIGAIQLELLAAGAARATSVDATEAYVAVAREEAERQGVLDRIDRRLGRFEELTDDVEPADVVTLDRVICCDPDVDALLGAVVARSRRIVGLVYPRMTWWNALASRAIAAWGWIARDPTRWRLHPDARVDEILSTAGFRRRDVQRTFIWQVVVFERV